MLSQKDVFLQAVLCPLAIDTLIMKNSTDVHQMKYAEDLMRLIVQAILITTPIGYLLTNHLGPVLLKSKPKKDKGTHTFNYSRCYLGRKKLHA